MYWVRSFGPHPRRRVVTGEGLLRMACRGPLKLGLALPPPGTAHRQERGTGKLLSLHSQLFPEEVQTLPLQSLERGTEEPEHPGREAKEAATSPVGSKKLRWQDIHSSSRGGRQKPEACDNRRSGPRSASTPREALCEHILVDSARLS